MNGDSHTTHSCPTCGYVHLPPQTSLAANLCHDVFPPHLNPPPGPPSVPRKCALPAGHDGQHNRDGVRW